jgi:hypothetical protein
LPIPLTVTRPGAKKSPEIVNLQIGTTISKRVLCVLPEMRLRVKRLLSRCPVVQYLVGKLSVLLGGRGIAVMRLLFWISYRGITITPIIEDIL